MRIHDGYRPPFDPGTKPADASRASGAERPAGQPASGGAVKVSVSDKARDLARASHDEQARVESLRQSIQAGTFKVDAKAIATKMLGDQDGDSA